jgi:hypothetical protein
MRGNPLHLRTRFRGLGRALAAEQKEADDLVQREHQREQVAEDLFAEMVACLRKSWWVLKLEGLSNLMKTRSRGDGGARASFAVVMRERVLPYLQRIEIRCEFDGNLTPWCE